MPASEELRQYGLSSVGTESHETECKICLSAIEDAVLTACKHIFCWFCLKTWFRENVTCPMCRCDLARVRRDQQLTSHNALPASIQDADADQPSMNASRTIDLSIRGDLVALTPLVLDAQRSRAVSAQVHSLPRSVASVSQSPQNDRESSQYAPTSGNLSANSHGDGDQTPTTTFVPIAATVVIDSQRLLAAIRAEANKLAGMRGISQRMDYSQAAKAVYGQWKRFFERKAGQRLHKYDLMWLLAEEMNLALAEAGIVDFARGEVLPHRLSKYLRDVARAGIDAQVYVCSL